MVCPNIGKDGVTVEIADEIGTSFALGLLHPQAVILSDLTVARGDWSKQTLFQKLLDRYPTIPEDSVLTIYEKTLFGKHPVDRKTLQIPLGTATEDQVLGEIALAIGFTIEDISPKKALRSAPD